MSDEWGGDHPFYLVISPMPADSRGNVVIDLDSPWHTTHADLMRVPALWQLVHKQSGQPVMALFVYDGEQPYCASRHVGVTGGGSNEIMAYGIGKKLADGSMQRIWLLPNGTICSGDDVDPLGVMLVHQLGPR